MNSSSWKTTLFGAGGLLWLLVNALQLLCDGDPATNPDWNVVIPAVCVAIGTIFAKDSDKTHAINALSDPKSAKSLLLLFVFLLPALVLTSCGGLTVGPVGVKVCKDDVCLGFDIPRQVIGAGKTVVDVQPAPATPAKEVKAAP